MGDHLGSKNTKCQRLLVLLAFELLFFLSYPQAFLTSIHSFMHGGVTGVNITLNSTK